MSTALSVISAPPTSTSTATPSTAPATSTAIPRERQLFLPAAIEAMQGAPDKIREAQRLVTELQSLNTTLETSSKKPLSNAELRKQTRAYAEQKKTAASILSFLEKLRHTINTVQPTTQLPLQGNRLIQLRQFGMEADFNQWIADAKQDVRDMEQTVEKIQAFSTGYETNFNQVITSLDSLCHRQLAAAQQLGLMDFLFWASAGHYIERFNTYCDDSPKLNAQSTSSSTTAPATSSNTSASSITTTSTSTLPSTTRPQTTTSTAISASSQPQSTTLRTITPLNLLYRRHLCAAKRFGTINFFFLESFENADHCIESDMERLSTHYGISPNFNTQSTSISTTAPSTSSNTSASSITTASTSMPPTTTRPQTATSTATPTSSQPQLTTSSTGAATPSPSKPVTSATMTAQASTSRATSTTDSKVTTTIIQAASGKTEAPAHQQEVDNKKCPWEGKRTPPDKIADAFRLMGAPWVILHNTLEEHIQNVQARPINTQSLTEAFEFFKLTLEAALNTPPIKENQLPSGLSRRTEWRQDMDHTITLLTTLRSALLAADFRLIIIRNRLSP